MGKIVKYCAKCEESFSEKFSFCPNCASSMTAYEMSPVMAETKVPEPEPVKIFEPAEEIVETKPVESVMAENNIEPEPPIFLSQTSDDDILEFADDEIEEEAPATVPAVTLASIKEVEEANAPTEEFTAPVTVESVPEPIPVVAAPTVSSVAPSNVEDYQRTYQGQTSTFAAKSSNESYQSTSSNKKLGDDGFYNVTLVEEKNGGTRNMLLLGAAFLVMTFSFGALIFSIFNNNAYVGGLEDDLNNIVFVGEDIPTEIEEPEKPKAKEDSEDGGGGGGKEDPTPVSKGRIADLVKNPDVPPSAKMDQVTNPELRLNVGVKSDKEVRQKPSDERYGDPNSKFDVASDGPGTGGGQGRGNGRGQGDGQGDGLRYGSGGGQGGNNPGGTPGRRTDDDDDAPPPTPRPAGPTVALAITSKPRANYTDAARQNQVTGTVTLRVTFNANGTIGSISAVSGLPYGLTEQAIAAARNMRFTPQLKGGVPQTVIKQVQYNFTLY